jgi:hypothetical protein
MEFKRMVEENKIKLLTLITPYAVAVSMLYLFGYWSSFGINILEYVSFPDVLKLAIYPVFIGALIITSGIITRAFLLDLDSIKRDEPEKIFMMVSRRYARWSSFVAFIGMILILIFIKEPQKWYLVGLLITYILIISIEDISFLRPFLPNSAIRRWVVVASILVLTGSFGIGKQNADLILSGKRARIMSTKAFRDKGNDVFKSKGLLEGQDSLKYLGAAGDYFFFISMDNLKTYAVKYSDLYFLELSDMKQLVAQEPPGY